MEDAEKAEKAEKVKTAEERAEKTGAENVENAENCVDAREERLEAELPATQRLLTQRWPKGQSKSLTQMTTDDCEKRLDRLLVGCRLQLFLSLHPPIPTDMQHAHAVARQHAAYQ